MLITKFKQGNAFTLSFPSRKKWTSNLLDVFLLPLDLLRLWEVENRHARHQLLDVSSHDAVPYTLAASRGAARDRWYEVIMCLCRRSDEQTRRRLVFIATQALAITCDVWHITILFVSDDDGLWAGGGGGPPLVLPQWCPLRWKFSYREILRILLTINRNTQIPQTTTVKSSLWHAHLELLRYRESLANFRRHTSL